MDLHVGSDMGKQVADIEIGAVHSEGHVGGSSAVGSRDRNENLESRGALFSSGWVAGWKVAKPMFTLAHLIFGLLTRFALLKGSAIQCMMHSRYCHFASRKGR